MNDDNGNLENPEIFRHSEDEFFLSRADVWLRCYERSLPSCIRLNADDDQAAVNQAARVAYLSVNKIFGPF